CFAVVAGGGLALLFIMWFEVISHLHPTQMLLCYSCAAVGRVCIIWLCGGLSPDRLWVCVFAITILAVATLSRARLHVPETTPQSSPQTSPHAVHKPAATSASSLAPEVRCAFPLRPLLVVVSGTVALSFTLAAISNTWGINGNPGVLIASAGVVALILMKGEFFEFKWLWQGAVAFMTASVTVFLLVGGLPNSFPGLLACVAYELCLMLMYSILSDLVYRSFYNPTFLFSVEIAVALSAGHIGDSLAAKCAGLIPQQSTLVLATLCAVVCGLFALACINAFAKRGLEDAWAALMRKPVAQDMDLLLERSRLGLRCHELAQEAGLSRREEEVLVLLAQKKKPSLIAKQLVIEVSTVNTHKKHLYQKLDVHSAKELQQRIGSVEED
ncbi:MAG: helix-turn-helix transcriptional regulator, partial [Eggerthellales bacterium]|nr:helix-turn-helix transcriptional regulator [Eggerthellales bacterium]